MGIWSALQITVRTLLIKHVSSAWVISPVLSVCICGSRSTLAVVRATRCVPVSVHSTTPQKWNNYRAQSMTDTIRNLRRGRHAQLWMLHSIKLFTICRSFICRLKLVASCRRRLVAHYAIMRLTFWLSESSNRMYRWKALLDHRPAAFSDWLLTPRLLAVVAAPIRRLWLEIPAPGKAARSRALTSAAFKGLPIWCKKSVPGLLPLRAR